MTPVWEVAVHLDVAGDVFDDVFLCCPFFPRDVLDEICDLIVSVSGGFPFYSYIPCTAFTEMIRLVNWLFWV